MVSEVGVDTNTIGFVARHSIIDLVTSEFAVSIRGVDVVWEFGLVEDREAIVAVPLGHVTECVLNGKTVSYNIVTVDDDARCYRVVAVIDKTLFIVVGTPQPGVINDDIAAVDSDHCLGFGWVCMLVVSSADSGEHVRHYTRVVSVTSVAFGSPGEESIRLGFASLEKNASNSDTIDISYLNTWLTSGRDQSGKTNTKKDLASLIDFN